MLRCIIAHEIAEQPVGAKAPGVDGRSQRRADADTLQSNVAGRRPDAVANFMRSLGLMMCSFGLAMCQQARDEDDQPVANAGAGTLASCPGLVGEAHQHLAQLAGTGHALGKVEPQRVALGRKVDAVGIAAGHAPVCWRGAQ